MERPIIFDTEMVRAILDNRKTQTRRIIKPKPEPREMIGAPKSFLAFGYDSTPNSRKCHPAFGFVTENEYFKCPYGKPGDLLYVRETFFNIAIFTSCLQVRFEDVYDYGSGERIIYKADNHPIIDFNYKWKPSIHMPKKYARIWLKIKDIRVERVQNISKEDAKYEGIERVGGVFSCSPYKNYAFGKSRKRKLHCSSPIRSFQTLWDSINKKRGYGWAVNPWVWIVEFERVNMINKEGYEKLF